MNKSALKTFATSARKELLKKVEAKAMKIGITEDNIKKADVESSDAIFIDGRQLSREEKTQRDKLIARINQIGFKQVMEEVAYTWFNRFTALRFMEVNDYLPTGVRVLSSSNPNSADPDMINEAMEIELEIELDRELIYNLKLNNQTEELFKYLIIKHCNNLNRILPFMFETIDDYTEILFPEGLLAKESFIRQMTDKEFIPEDNWKKVEVIGWLYQYYIAEEKDRVIQAKKKYNTEEIPYATQLFTPDWIVKYMVQNSLGRYWVESHPEHRDLLSNWEFYLENTNPEPDLEEMLAPYINKELKVEDIKCFDPAMGSGHILVYMFDVLYEIYSKCGYMEREIPKLIIENNLYGLDIDDRAYQLACFSVVMKALEYNNRFFRSIERDGVVLNLVSIQETNMLSEEDISFISGENSGLLFENTKKIIGNFRDAKSTGSLIVIEEFEQDFFKNRLNDIQEKPAKDLFEEEKRKKALVLLPTLIKQSEIMVNKYDVLITNPPYMGNKYMNSTLDNFIKNNYIDFKADTFAAFIAMCISKVKANGHLGFVTPFVWMFISSYENLRRQIVERKNISTLVQLEYNAFPGVTVPVCTFTLRNYPVDISGEYIKLSEFTGIENQPHKTLEAIENPEVNYRYTANSKNFKAIEGTPIAYWGSSKVREIFRKEKKLGDIASPRKGNSTSDNKRFLRLWHEVELTKVNFNAEKIVKEETKIKRWFPYNKGGGYRKWYGFNEYLIDWKNDAEEIRNIPTAVIANYDFFMKPGLTWSTITSTNFSIRMFGNGFIFDNGGCCLFTNDEDRLFYLALLNSKVFNYLLGEINPTLNYQSGEVAKFPVKFAGDNEKIEINKLSLENFNISKLDWDSYETSWDFDKHFLIKHKNNSMLIEEAYESWREFTKRQFNKVLENEYRLNELFISLYGLEDEISPEVDKSGITIREANPEKDVISFISYAIGCIFGRYSLDTDGILYTGGNFVLGNYYKFKPDSDNILPILPGTHFEDDIVSRFIDFVKITFGEETLNKNLDFIADILGRKKGELGKETIRRYFLNEFFKNHVQTYKKRPIYWLFSSGKQKAFNCLIYMHRYNKTTLSRIRTDYLHEYQIRLDAEKKELLSIIEGDYSTKEISNAKKELKVLDRKIEELKEYDELLHHMADMQIEIDLDEGVVQNYEMFNGLVAKI